MGIVWEWLYQHLQRLGNQRGVKKRRTVLSMGGGHADRVQGERTEGDKQQVEIQRKSGCLVCLSVFFSRNSFYLCYISSYEYIFSKTFFLKKSQTIGQKDIYLVCYMLHSLFCKKAGLSDKYP